MAADKIVKSFLILFFVECIVRDGSCAPIQENIVLDNGTVLTMVIHDVQEAPPPRFDSALDGGSDEDNKPVIVIHEAQYAPAPHVISKRSADPDDGEDPKPEIKIADPIAPPTPQAESDEDLAEINTPSAPVKDGAQTEKVLEVQGKGSAEKGKSETGKVSEAPESAKLKGTGDGQPAGEDENETKDKHVGDGVQGKTTPVAVPNQPTEKVVGSGNSDSNDGGKGGDKTADVTPSGESLSPKSSTEAINDPDDKDSSKPSVSAPTDEHKDDEGTDNDGDDDDDDESVKEPNDKDRSKPSVITSTDEPDDGELTHGNDDDQHDTDDDEDDEKNSDAYHYDPVDDPEEKKTSDGNDEEENEEDDDNEGEINDSDGSSSLKKGVSETQSSGHFMSYFLIAVVFVACFYLVFHNRQKIKAYVLEGKTGRGRRRKTGDSEYRPLSTAEEVLPSADKGIESKIAYTY